MDGTKVFTENLQELKWFSNNVLKESLFILTIVLLMIFIQRRRKKELPNFPSGPSGIPILGYIPFLACNSHLTLHEIRKKYGGMFSIQVGNKKVLVLANYSSIKEAYSNEAFSGRPDCGNFTISEYHAGYIDDSGKSWKDQRFFCQKVLQSLGSNSVCAENLVTEELLLLLENIKDRKGEPFHVESLFLASIGNLISKLLYGKRFDYNDPLRHRIDQSLISMSHSTQLVALFNCLPFGKLLRRFSPTFMAGVRDSFFLYDVFRKEVSLNERNFDKNNLQNFIHFYLNEVNKNDGGSGAFFTRDTLLGNIWLYSSAGYETVGNSVNWLLLVMAKFTDVQDRVQKEIDEIIGERLPTWSDRYMMPYTRAVITELQRWRTIAPNSLPRATTKDTKLQGYDIPKGTIVLALLHSAHYDTDYWENPEEFRPERFLTEDGKTFVSKDAYIPFSFGRRSCPGKIFASISIFLYLTLVLQSYRVKSGQKEDIDFEGNVVVTNTPKSQKLSFVPLGK